jgi:gamma-glutamylcyclotransferase (GGCT)/AIG2-like uncharacterized protein YtfP
VQSLYFAYGSNLQSARMCERVPSAAARGPARLSGWRLTTDKRGRDGTGKANLRRDPASAVWGVVWAIDPAEWPQLDGFEGGYARIEVEVETPLGARLPVSTYTSDLLTDTPLLDRAYKRAVVEGAREHGLPEAWIARLEALPERSA